MLMTELTDFLCNVYLPILIPGVTAVFMLNVNLLSQKKTNLLILIDNYIVTLFLVLRTLNLFF